MRRFFFALVLLVAAGILLPPLYYAIFPVETPDLPPAGRRIPVAEGVAVNAIEKGVGRPVVLVHGLPGSAYDWAPLTDALADRGHRVLAYDRVGYGHSDARRNGEFTIESNAGELLALLETEGLEDATVIGWSYGGATSIRAALTDPSRIGRLVLVGSAGPAEMMEEPPAIFALIFSAPAVAWYAAVPPVGRALQRGMSVQAFSEQPQPDWWLPQVAANFARPNTRDTFRGEGANFDPSNLDPAPIERPILIIHGDDDRNAPIAIGRWLHEHAANSELYVIEGGSHMLPITHADSLADRITSFMAAR